MLTALNMGHSTSDMTAMDVHAGGRTLAPLQVSSRGPSTDSVAGDEAGFGLSAVAEVLGFCTSTINSGGPSTAPDLHIFGMQLTHAAIAAGGQGGPQDSL